MVSGGRGSKPGRAEWRSPTAHTLLPQGPNPFKTSPMERHIWKKYGTGEVNDKIIYWVDLWDDLVDHFTKDHYGLELDNPHVLLLVLVDEIEYDELRNEEVRKYLL